MQFPPSWMFVNVRIIFANDQPGRQINKPIAWTWEYSGQNAYTDDLKYLKYLAPNDALHLDGPVQEDETTVTCNTQGRGEKCIQGVGGKTKGKVPVDKPRRRRETNVNLNLKYVHCEDVDLTYLAQDRKKWQAFVSKLMYLQVP
jgi:hypothetical protein